MSETCLDVLGAEALERVQRPLAESWTLPPAAYIEPAVFAAEVRTTFARDWVCVGRTDQIPEPGDYLSVDLVDQPLVITRSDDGELHALSRVCLHRAMPLVEGAGNARRLVCPYHNWTYELDGRLRAAPMMDGVTDFEPAQCRLPELRLETWNGFIFVNRDEQAQSLAPQLSGLTALVEDYGFADMRVVHTIAYDSPWNWKILVENFMEAYHHIGTHRESLQPLYPARDSMVEDNGERPWACLRMPPRQAGESNTGHGTTESDLFAACVFPTFLIASTGDGGVWYQLEPTAHDAMQLRIHALANSAADEDSDPEALAGLEAMLRGVHEEDIVANHGPWRGLHGALTRQGRLSPYEKAIWQLNQLWVQRVMSAPLASSNR